MAKSLEELNNLRVGKFKKDVGDEEFLKLLNSYLESEESQNYGDCEINHPFLFIIGIPRAGTTIIAQLLMSAFDLGYPSNFIARFWLAPVTGIKLQQIIFGKKKPLEFNSEYGWTNNPLDIHEFGYYWRKWLLKNSFEDFKNYKTREKEIEWGNLKTSLANIQHTFDKPVLFRHVLAGFHLNKFVECLDKVLFIYIQRDLTDNAISLLDARERFFGDRTKWFSTHPPNYEHLINLEPFEQVAGQVHSLKTFYESQMIGPVKDRIISVPYKELCNSPDAIVENIRNRSRELFNYEMHTNDRFPQSFEFRSYNDRPHDRKKFDQLFQQLSEQT